MLAKILIPSWTLRTLLFLMGTISPRAYAADPALRNDLVIAMGGTCPKVAVQIQGGPRCIEGEAGCLDDVNGRKALETIKQGCADGKGGEGAPCLYGIFIRKDGKAVAVCGPRMLGASR